MVLVCRARLRGKPDWLDALSHPQNSHGDSMTDHQHCELSKRDFEILAFIFRNGKLYRKDRQSRILSTVDNVSGIITNLVRAQVAQGRCVIVLEHGAIKSDWSRIQPQHLALLKSLPRDCMRQLVRNVEILHDVSLESFREHINRTFP
jgi:hypothetical protein